MTILVLFDRLNADIYTPKCWKPGNWFETNLGREISQFQRQKTLTFFKNLNPRPSIIATQKKKFKINQDKYIDTDYLMKNDFKVENYMAFEDKDFGSHLYVIRSNYLNQLRDETSQEKMKKTSQILPPLEIKDKLSTVEPRKTSESKTARNSTNHTKTVQFGSETPLTIHTVTTLSNFTDKVIKPSFIQKPELPPIEATPLQSRSGQKPYIYEDIIKKMHKARRLAHTTNVLASNNEIKMKKYRTLIPMYSNSDSNSNTASITPFSNNDLNLKTEFFKKQNSRRLLEQDFNSSSTSKKNRNVITQSLDTFYKISSKKRYLISNHVIWTNFDSKNIINTSSFNESKREIQNDLEKSILL
jgi:hypothetical protein